jgi:hypothetical protein
MLQKVGPQTVSSDEGWSVYAQSHLAIYKEQGRSLRVDTDLGFTPDNQTTVHLINSAWRWDGPPGTGNDITDLETRRRIVQRLKQAIELMGTPVRTGALEVSAGLAPAPTNPWGPGKDPKVEWVDDKTVRYSMQGRTLTVPFTVAGTNQAQIDFAQLRQWDPPHNNELVGLGDQQMAIMNLMYLLEKRGYSLLVKK